MTIIDYFQAKWSHGNYEHPFVHLNKQSWGRSHFSFTSQSGCVKIDKVASLNKIAFHDHIHSKCKKNAFIDENENWCPVLYQMGENNKVQCALPVFDEIFVLGCACEESSAPESTASPAEWGSYWRVQ